MKAGKFRVSVPELPFNWLLLEVDGNLDDPEFMRLHLHIDDIYDLHYLTGRIISKSEVKK